ncbi:MAG: GIY-YIG nuclease family protein [Candidatus Lokiarchaeota archaeon]|nr:GIY-YIG nuclease family protein [Candidatus Lokiarchaeota archaeon]
MTAYFVYMLEVTALDGKRSMYVGSTNSMERRYREHVHGDGAKFTRNKHVKLVFYQTFKTRSEAMQRELQLKRFPPAKKLALVDDIFENEYLTDDEIKIPLPPGTVDG